MEKVCENIFYIGVEDKTLDLFESQYPIQNGVTYNSYLIKDEQNVVMDTVDSRKTEEWLKNLEEALQGEKVDFLVVSHLEPDHSGSIKEILEKYPQMKVIGNAKTFAMLPQFVNINLEDRKVVVAESEKLEFGKHSLQFFMAPMVHWPEVMVSYELTEQILFSADGFGTFGIVEEKDWEDDARRYYFNIVGKYGMQVQMLLKKAATLDIKKICALHGPVLAENINKYINLYNTWSSYKPEKEGILIAYSSIHGNTKKVVELLEKLLKEKGKENIVLRDLTRESLSYAISDAFMYDKLVIASATYNMQLFPPMQSFLHQLSSKNYQNRKIAMIENGSWAPNAINCMKEYTNKMKDITIYEPEITIKTTLNEETKNKLEELANNLIK